ncbi:hypothetical protein NU10_08865 [Flavobacterium dauae]|uniref:hypothetical protein n=1 Tax=Flavobacterium dauae TaxID=1563479 RepID=UPI00101D1294|nr:hypothetical protein [Flavobacterium dauae]WLD22835.1 hypothetical protein NU10_08865 [Flavobacterium dauae]
MKKILFVIVCLTFLTCKKEKVKSLDEKEKLSETTLYTKDSLRKKFIAKYNFKDFPVDKEVLKNDYTKVDVYSTEFGKWYRTMIRQSFNYGTTNFAGKYILNYWGCGSPCAVGVIINVENGKIIELPVSSVGYKYQINSRMLIVNPTDSLDYYYNSFLYEPKIYVLDTIQNVFIAKQ